MLCTAAGLLRARSGLCGSGPDVLRSGADLLCAGPELRCAGVRWDGGSGRGPDARSGSSGL